MNKWEALSILEINEEDSKIEEKLKRRYRKLSLRHHPDKNNNSKESTKKFQEINAAYDFLSNLQKGDERSFAFGENDNSKKYYSHRRGNNNFHYNYQFDPWSYRKGSHKYEDERSSSSIGQIFLVLNLFLSAVKLFEFMYLFIYWWCSWKCVRFAIYVSFYLLLKNLPIVALFVLIETFIFLITVVYKKNRNVDDI